MKQKFSIAMSLAVILAMLLTSLALADQLVNNIDSTIDNALESTTITAGGSATVGFFVQPSNTIPSDDANGCNATGANPATISFILPIGVSASPASLTFDGCGVVKNAVFSSNASGSYTIGVSSVAGGKAGSLWDTAPASFTLVVNAAPPSDTTAPDITPSVVGTLGNNDWYTSDVTVSWIVNDDQSAVSSTTGCDPTTINADSAGTTLTCTATSAGGTNTQSVTIKRDATAPIASAAAAPAANTSGWNNTAVTVSFSGTDNLSGIDFCSAAVVLSSDGANQSASGTCTDLAGNMSAPAIVNGINIDKTAPTAGASASPAANGNGWNNTAVTVSFTGDDGTGSGIDFCSDAVVLSSAGAGQSASGTCTDKAGNVSNTATASNINIDLVNPTVGLVGGPANGGSYYFGFVPAAPTCSASDDLSGVDGLCSVSGYSDTIGQHTVTASATDKAGNSASVSATYTVSAWTLSGFYQPVDMGGVWNTVKNGSTVPLKFEIFAGNTELMLTSYVKSLTYTAVNCSTLPTDEIELTATGQTSLRYDATAGQFIYNWQTPKTAGACYRVTMTTQDGSFLQAFFKLK